MYKEHMKHARSSEKIKDAFVDCAITVFKRVLSNSEANKWLQWCEESLIEKSPWKSIYALQAAIDRAQSQEKIAWAIWGITDHYRMDRPCAKQWRREKGGGGRRE